MADQEERSTEQGQVSQEPKEVETPALPVVKQVQQQQQPEQTKHLPVVVSPTEKGQKSEPPEVEQKASVGETESTGTEVVE